MTLVMTWLVHCAIIAVVLTGAAMAWELSARWSGRSVRWAWLGALAGSVTLPWLLRLLPDRSATGPVPTAVPLFSLDPITLGGTTQGGVWSAADVALFGWAGISLLAVAYVSYMMVQLARAQKAWRPTELDGMAVFVARNAGPAALGVRRGIVVIPTWALQLDVQLRGLLLLHEREHVRAGDPRLLLAGLLLVVAMPWNPVLWFQLLRLRNAIELDCDARVLSRGADPERYGSLLLEVGRRRAGSALVMATFAEPRVFLHERIRRIARWPIERRPGRAWLFSLLALGLLATALNARDPLRSGAALPASDAADLVSERVVMEPDTPPAGPVFTPMTEAPELQNRDEVRRALREHYPPMLADAGIGGRVTLWFHIDRTGELQETQLSKSSGHAALDEAARNVAKVMRFSPALNGDERVAVWVEMPVIFTAPGSQPELLNRAEVGRMLETSYPPLLRDAGIGGTAHMAIMVTAAGEPTDILLVNSSGHTTLDNAAMKVAQIMRFRPAQRDGQAIDARTEVPIAFTARGRRPVTQHTIDAVGEQRTEPVFTPLTDAPELLNRADVQRELEQRYPPLLRAAGIGGRPTVWLYINPEGVVEDVRLSTTTGHPELDEAALHVATIMRFSAARNRGERVAVWIELPIVFTAR